MSAGECPGFVPHFAKASRCKRCFRDVSEHGKAPAASAAPPGPAGKSTSERQAGKHPAQSSKDSGSKPQNTRAVPTPGPSAAATAGDPKAAKAAAAAASAATTGSTPEEDAKTAVRRRRTVDESATEEGETTNVKLRRRRPLSAGSSEDVENSSSRNSTGSSYKSDSESLSSDSDQLPTAAKDKERRRSQRIKIVEAQEVEKSSSPALPTDTATVASPSADVEFILKVKTTAIQQREDRCDDDDDDDDDDGSVALTETTETTDTTLAYYDSYEDMENSVAKLKSQLAAAEDKIQRLEKEKLDQQKRRSELTDSDKKTLEKTASEILKLRSKNNELEAINEELKDDNKCLKLEVKELQEEVDKRNADEDAKKEAETLRVKLQQAESLCEELMEENEEIKKEVQDLEEQLEELQDSYREDQQSEYQDLKKELESTSKNCRVLQFKLRKAERRCEQLELERGQLDDKVADLQKTAQIEVDKTRMKVLEDELHVANQLSVKLATEMEVLKDAKTKLEMDNASLKKQLSSGAKGVTVSQASKSKESVMGKDYETMCKDLYDSMERETDLREQLRFAEEESKTMRRKMNNMEQENETLMLQIRKLSGRRDSISSGPAGGGDNDDSSDEEASLEELRMQFELQEQETSVLRRKVEEKEQQIEGLEKEVKYLQDKLVSQPFTKIDLPAPPKNEADVDVYHRQKAKLLEYEARELRQKLIEKERENERLQTEVEVHRRKASKVIVRSRSLDSELQVDLKRQLQLVEQEAGLLRQKAQDLEADNDRLTAENKRCQLRLSRKPPPGPQELLQLDNMELKEKLSDAERKLNVLKEELEKVAAGATPSAVVIQEYAPKKEKPSDMENELIAGLKRKVRAKEEETSALQTKIVQLEVENSRLSREFKKLKEAVNYKRKTPRVVRETATRGELKDIIRDLEDEISELHVTLRSREVTQEGMLEEVESAKKSLEEEKLKVKQRESKMASELECLRKKKDQLQEELQKERKMAQALKKQLESMMKGSAGGPEGGATADVIEKIASLQIIEEKAAKKEKELEQKLTQEHNKNKELEERMGVMSKLNESLAASVKLLESKGKELEEELQQRKKALQSAETQAKLLKGKLESTESGYTQLKKECNQLRSELQEAKSKDSNAPSPASPAQAGVTWTKEREELRRKIEDMRQTLDVMTRKEVEKDKQFQEKENRLKQEHEKKLERNLKDVREFLQAEIKNLQEEHNSMKNRLNETIDKAEKKENELKAVSDKLRQLTNSQRREKEDWQLKMDDLEEKLRTELRKRERMEREHELDSKSKAEDVLAAQNRVVQLEREHRRLVAKLQEMEEESAEQRKQMEKDAAKEREEYDDLTTRYEVLEEEFLTMKNNLTLEKDQLDAALKQLRKEHERISAELRSVKETLNARQELYTREKSEFQNLIRELEVRVTRLKDIEAERNRMRSNLNERDAIIEELKKTEKCFREEKEKLRRKNEELMKRVAELERSERHLRTLTVGGPKADNAQQPNRPLPQPNMQQQELRARLEHSGHVHKAEQAALRADYEGRVSFMSGELQALQAQVASLARERDQCREKLDEAAREIEQLRSNTARRERSRGKEAFDAMHKKAEELRAYADDLKNQLEESLTDNRKLRIQVDADKSSWEIQLSNLKSKLNQYEERNILEASRGSAKLYAKTRLELAWEKERTDLQKVLADTQTTMADLKERFLKAEAEREAEREASAKTIQDLRKKVDGGQDDVSKDILELQTDLEELKDTHERLKTQYDRLRREKERLERDREDLRYRAGATQDVQALVTDLVEDVRKMGELVNLEGIFAADQGKAKAAQRPLRTGGSTPKDDLVATLQKVTQRTERLREVSKPVRDEDMIRRTTSFRRALSATDMANQAAGGLMPVIRAPPRTRGGAMHSKALSLGHGMTGAELKIWGSGDSLAYTPYGSQNSLTRSRGGTGYDSDASVVSEPPRHWRYSRPAVRVDSENDSSNPGSTEDVTAATKHRKTLKERLKLLKKPSTNEPKQESDKDEKRGTLRSRLTKAFRPGSKEKIDSPSPTASERRPVVAQQKLEPVKERSRVERSSSLSAKAEKGSKKSLLGRLTSKESTGKAATTDSPNGAKPPPTPVKERKGSFNETPV